MEQHARQPRKIAGCFATASVIGEHYRDWAIAFTSVFPARSRTSSLAIRRPSCRIRPNMSSGNALLISSQMGRNLPRLPYGATYDIFLDLTGVGNGSNIGKGYPHDH